MVGWHHQLNGCEFEQTPGDGEEQGSLACCGPWGHQESDTTERLNNYSLEIQAQISSTSLYKAQKGSSQQKKHHAWFLFHLKMFFIYKFFLKVQLNQIAEPESDCFMIMEERTQEHKCSAGNQAGKDVTCGSIRD